MKKNIYLFTIVLSLVTMFSCSFGTNDVFDDSANNRISASLKEYKNILCAAENGWIMKYYPSPTLEFGGYNLLVSFSEDGYCTIASELEATDATCTSLYRLKEMAGPVLTFDTENKFLHFFSDPASGVGDLGLGMEGDYEFLFVDVTPEKVILKGKKTGNNIELIPMPKDLSWTNYLADISAGLDKTDYYIMFNYNVSDKDYSVIRSNRVLAFSYSDETGEEVTFSAPFIQSSDNSIEFYKPITLGDVEVYKLYYDASVGNWKDENSKVTLSGIIPPESVAFMFALPWYVTYDGLREYGKQVTDNVYQSIFTGENGFNVMGIGDFGNGENSITFITKDGNVGTLGLEIRKTDNAKVGLMLTGFGNNYGVELWNNGASAFYGLFADIEQYKEFELVLNHPTQPTQAILTEVGNPNNVITLTTSEAEFGK